MLVVAEPVDDQDVAGAQQAERVVQQRRILSRDRQRHRRAGDAAAFQQRLDAAIHETPVTAVADGCGFHLHQLLRKALP